MPTPHLERAAGERASAAPFMGEGERGDHRRTRQYSNSREAEVSTNWASLRLNRPGNSGDHINPIGGGHEGGARSPMAVHNDVVTY